jgi:NADPH-dependent 2,4-dienoyl-CoA reductase/sulfur reductase-like enzyme
LSSNNNRRKRILVIGGVAAGTSAASKAKRFDPNAEIKILQEEPVVSYGACGIPYVIEGVIDDFRELIERTADEFKSKYDIDVIVNTQARKIDTVRKQVHAVDLKTNDELVFDYDSLIIATGARAIIPKIKGIDNNRQGIFLVRNYGDGIRIKNSIQNINSCVIVGAGLIGIEMAEAFIKRGIDTTIVEMADHVLPSILDNNNSMANIVKRELEDNGVKIILGERLEQVLGNGNNVKGIKTNKREMIATDFILLGTGVKPNSEIAKEAGIELGFANAIRVDNHMRTNIRGIFAAGDCATAKNYITNKDDYLPLGTTANKQGRVAGENAAGGGAIFKGIAGSAITKTFGLFIGKTGLSKDEALGNGFEPVEKEIESITRSGYYPSSKSIWIKIVADKKSQRVLGAQIVGGEAVKGRIDLIALALLLKANVSDLINYDACYVPPASPVWEPVNIAASQVARLLISRDC